MSDPSRIRRRRFRWQISLRTFLIVSLLLCPLTIFLYSEYREFRAHRQEIERRISEGAIVIYEYQVDENGYYIANAPPPLKPGFFLKMHCHSNSDGFVTRLLANPKVTVKTQVALTNAYGQTDLSFFSDKDFVTDLDLGKFGRLTRLDGIEKLKSLATVKFGRPIGHSYLEDISALGKCPGLKRIEFSETHGRRRVGVEFNNSTGVSLEQLNNVLKALPNTQFSGDVRFKYVPKISTRNYGQDETLFSVGPAVFDVNELPENFVHGIQEKLKDFDEIVALIRGQDDVAYLMIMDQIRSLTIHPEANVRLSEVLNQMPKLEQVHVRYPGRLERLDLEEVVDLYHLTLAFPDDLVMFLGSKLKNRIPSLSIHNLDLTTLDLTQMTGLRELKVRRCDSLTQILWPPKIERVTIGNCALLKEIDLSGHPTVQELKINSCLQLESVNISDTANLATLMVDNRNRDSTKTGGDSLSSVEARAAVALDHVGLQRCQLLEKLELPDARQLTQVELVGCPKLKTLTGPDNLEFDRLVCVSCPSLVSIEGIKHLRQLKYEYCPKRSLGFLESLTHPDDMESLEMRFPKERSLGDFEIPSIFVGLQSIKLSRGVKIGRDHLAALSNLKQLGLPETTTAVLEAIKHQTEMTELTLSNAEIENASLLANFKELDDLSIYDCPNLVSLDGLSAGALVNLSISNCAKLSDISALANADDLRFFRFWKCPNVQDFRPLSGLPKLQGFELSGVPVSEKQLRFLRDQFPDADVRVSSNGVSVYRKENPGPLESTIGK